MEFRKIWLNINGVDRVMECNPEKDTLADVIRRLGLTGTKVGCGTGQCGSCNVILDGELVRSCIKKIKVVPDFGEIITIEGIVNINGRENKEYPFKELIDRLRQLYDDAVARAGKENTPQKLRGVGIAMGGYNVTGGPNDRAEVAIGLNPDGTVTHYNSWEDQGQGSDVGTLVLTHEALRPLELSHAQIKLVQNDTARTPMTGPAGAYRSHYMAGNATIDAAKQLLSAMRKPDGSYRTYEEMIAENIPTKYLGVYDTTDITQDLDPNTGEGDPTPEYN